MKRVFTPSRKHRYTPGGTYKRNLVLSAFPVTMLTIGRRLPNKSLECPPSRNIAILKICNSNLVNVAHQPHTADGQGWHWKVTGPATHTEVCSRGESHEPLSMHLSPISMVRTVPTKCKKLVKWCLVEQCAFCPSHKVLHSKLKVWVECSAFIFQ